MADTPHSPSAVDRREFLQTSAAAGLSALAGRAPTTPARPPNFLILVGEGVRPDEFSSSSERGSSLPKIVVPILLLALAKARGLPG